MVPKVLERELLTVLSEDRSGQEAFLRRRMVPELLDPDRLSAYLDLMGAIHVQSGGLEPDEFVDLGGVLEIYVRSRIGRHRARLYLFLDPARPGLIREWGIVPLPDAGGIAPPWDEALDSATDVTEAVRQRVTWASERDLFSGVVLVAHGERILFHKGVGFAERSFGVPNQPDTKFNIASMGKMFTAVAIAQLVADGKLRFMDPLAAVLPNYPNRSAASKIRIHDLLAHTAGLGMLFERPGYDRRKRYARHANYFPLFAEAPLEFEPGTASGYSNEGYVVLGAIVEEVAGVDYEDYVQEHVFSRAGMTDTGSFAVDEVTPNRAVGYGRFEDDPFGIGPRRPNWMFLSRRGNACGGGYSTAPDLLRFARALRDNRLLDRSLTEVLLTPHPPAGRYGYGFQLTAVDGRRIIGHSGGGVHSGIDATLSVWWDDDAVLVVLSNYDSPAATDLSADITELLARWQRSL
jgi:CubicO group peptidase (beta-lactamase class C family)